MSTNESVVAYVNTEGAKAEGKEEHGAKHIKTGDGIGTIK